MDVVRAIVLLSPCALVTVLLLFLVAIRYIIYRERAVLAQHGMMPPEGSFWERIGHRTPRGVLWSGVITTMCGLALLLGLATVGIGPWLLGGLFPLFIGLGMVFIYFTGGGSRERGAGKKGRPSAEETASAEQNE